MRYLTLAEVLELHRRIIEAAGGTPTLHDLGVLQSAVAQPRMMFKEAELYPSLEEKAAALMYSLVMNHPFVDGNKRIGHAATEAFLMLNGHELVASIDESEEVVVSLASSRVGRERLVAWIRQKMRPIKEER